MAITKILARKARLDVGIRYVLNGDKTDDKILTAHQNCDPGLEYREMLATKRAVGKEGGVQYYHMIQSFQPGEVTPELALSIAKEFAREHLSGYEVVIGTHVDRGHIHSHLLFNSVSVGRIGHTCSLEKSFAGSVVRFLHAGVQRQDILAGCAGTMIKRVASVRWAGLKSAAYMRRFNGCIKN